MMFKAKRLSAEPIITAAMCNKIGNNINGPSLVRAPDWLPDRLGNYYLYFAHHKGQYIRLATADVLTGPWKIYTPGVLDVADSLFEKTDPLPLKDSGIEQAEWSRKLNDDFLYAHVASPDVHIDEEKRQIRMYYHGLLANGDQQTRLAVSADGIHFTPQKPLLGPPYFRAVMHQNMIYVLSWAGELWRSTSWEGPFEKGPRVLPDAPAPENFHGCRHCAVVSTERGLSVFYSRIGDKPERIVYVTVTTESDWSNWQSGPSFELLAPELEWEGVDCTLATSTIGEAGGRVNELRDPCYFADSDGQQYLLYSGAGESAIGIASLIEDNV